MGNQPSAAPGGAGAEPPVGEAPRASLADFAPFRVRPFAQLLTNSLDGLSLGGRILLTALMVLFGIHEMVQSRQEWYQGNAAIEQAKLARIQQQREAAETGRVQQEELTSLARQEEFITPGMFSGKYADVMPVNRFHGLFGRLFIQRLDRYEGLKKAAEGKLAQCNSCSDVEKQALERKVNAYTMFIQDSCAYLWSQGWESKRCENVSERFFEKDAAPESSTTPARPEAPSSQQ